MSQKRPAYLQRVPERLESVKASREITGGEIMKIRIGAIEIVDATWEELEQIVERYGGGDHESPHEADDDDADRPPPRRKNGNTTTPGDRVVLELLVSAGSSAVPTQELGDILGRRGKSIRPGLINWAMRVGLINDKNIDPFEEARAGSRRGARLKSSFLPVANELLSRMQ